MWRSRIFFTPNSAHHIVVWLERYRRRTGDFFCCFIVKMLTVVSKYCQPLVFIIKQSVLIAPLPDYYVSKRKQCVPPACTSRPQQKLARRSWCSSVYRNILTKIRSRGLTSDLPRSLRPDLGTTFSRAIKARCQAVIYVCSLSQFEYYSKLSRSR